MTAYVTYWYKSARLAIYSLLEQIRLKSGKQEVLLPAYHCKSIEQAIESAGCVAKFYRVHWNLEPDIESVEHLLGPETSAIVGIHYFGFRNNFRDLTNLCRFSNIPFITDAAHIDLAGGVNLSEHSDWQVFCPRKFYPIFDGGGLRFQPDAGYSPLEPIGCLKDEFRALNFLMEGICGKHTAVNSSPRPFDFMRDFRTIQSYVSPRSRAPDVSDDGYVDSRFDFHGRIGMTNISRFVLKSMSISKAHQKRRSNFKFLDHEIHGMPRIRPLPVRLQGDDVPYVYPAVLETPEFDHAEIRKTGIGILRWEDFSESECMVSDSYRDSLIQIPCHQYISRKSIRTLVECLSDVLRTGKKYA